MSERAPWWTMDRGSPEWLAEVIRSGQEEMRDLLDALASGRRPLAEGEQEGISESDD